MTRAQILLDQLMEECMEVGIRASKAVRFGLTEIQKGQDLTNLDRLKLELNDLFAVVDLIEDELNYRVYDPDMIAKKKES